MVQARRDVSAHDDDTPVETPTPYRSEVQKLLPEDAGRVHRCVLWAAVWTEGAVLLTGVLAVLFAAQTPAERWLTALCSATAYLLLPVLAGAYATLVHRRRKTPKDRWHVGLRAAGFTLLAPVYITVMVGLGTLFGGG